MRQLSVVQLQALAGRGSRRAQAELEARMAEPPPAAVPRDAAPVRAPPAGDRPATTPGQLAPPMPMPAHLSRLAQAPAEAMVGASHGAGATEEDPRVRQLQMLAQQDSAATRFRDLPQLIGLLLLVWGALMLFGGLVMLTHTGGSYYAVLSLGTLAVGWLLWKNSAWAMYLQPVLVLVALGWSWQAGGHSVFSMLVQSAPVWIPACWLPVPQVREPLL